MQELEFRLRHAAETLLAGLIDSQQAPGPFELAVSIIESMWCTEIRCSFGALHCNLLVRDEELARINPRGEAFLTFDFLGPLFRNIVGARRDRAQQDLEGARQREQEIQQYYCGMPVFTGYDIGTHDYTVIQVEIGRAADDTILQERRLQALDQMNQRIDETIENILHQARARARALEMPTNWAVNDAYAVQLWGAAVRQYYATDGLLGRVYGVPDKDASTRGWQLLLENLTPGQRHELETKNYFTVIGNASRRRYAIGKDITYNICLLTPGTAEWAEANYCFRPEGDLCLGDVMLTQKIALETNEVEALSIANVVMVSGPMSDYFPPPRSA